MTRILLRGPLWLNLPCFQEKNCRWSRGGVFRVGPALSISRPPPLLLTRRLPPEVGGLLQSQPWNCNLLSSAWTLTTTSAPAGGPSSPLTPSDTHQSPPHPEQQGSLCLQGLTVVLAAPRRDAHPRGELRQLFSKLDLCWWTRGMCAGLRAVSQGQHGIGVSFPSPCAGGRSRAEPRCQTDLRPHRVCTVGAGGMDCITNGGHRGHCCPDCAW